LSITAKMWRTGLYSANKLSVSQSLVSEISYRTGRNSAVWCATPNCWIFSTAFRALLVVPVSDLCRFKVYRPWKFYPN